MTSRYGGITGNVEISEDYSNINTAFENVEADVDAKALIVTNHINDNVRHVTEAEHTKLASVQEGAEPNQNAFSHVNNIDATAETDTLTIAQGTGIAITTNPTTKTLTITATGEATPGPHGSSHNNDGSDPIPDLVTLRSDFNTLDGEFDAHLVDFAAHEADYVRQPAFAVTGGTSTAYTVTLDPIPTSLPEGFGITIVPHVDCGDGPTLNVNGIGAVALKDQKGASLTAGKMTIGKPYTFRKVGTDFLADSGSGGGEEVNGQTEELVVFGETISAFDPIIVKNSFNKLSDPSTLPTGTTSGIALSSDGTYLAVGVTVSPNLFIYKRSGDIYTKLSDPATMPGSGIYSAVFSSDDTYLYLCSASSPYIYIYKRSGDTFTKLADPTILPTGAPNGVTCDASNTYVCVGHNISPFITIYKRSGDTFTKLSNPATLPPAVVYGVSFSSDGIYLVSGHDTSPFITIYKRSGDAFTKLSNPASLPPGTVRGVALNGDASYLVGISTTSPNMVIYRRSGDTFTKLNNPDAIPPGTLNYVCFTADQKNLIVTCTVSPYLYIYKQVGDVFIKISNPSSLPTGSGSKATSSLEYLAVSHATSPYMEIYKISLRAYKNVDASSWIDALRLGYASESGLADDSKQVIITHH